MQAQDTRHPDPSHSGLGSGQDAESVADMLDDLLGEPVVYVGGTAPAEPTPYDGFEMTPATGSREPRAEPISPVYWAAAVVWGLLGGVGGWYLLRGSHPREARAVLRVGIISFAVLTMIVIGAIALQRMFNPSTVYIRLY